MEGTMTALLIGTRGGLFRLQDGIVAAVSGGSDPIESLLPLAGDQLLAGTARARVLRFGSGGRVGPVGDAMAHGAIASLFVVPGTKRVLAGASDGALFFSDDLGARFRAMARFPATGARVELAGVPGRPRSVFVFSESGVLHSPDGGATFETWSSTRLDGLAGVVVHPFEPQLWLAATRDALLRSLDGARTFRRADGLPDGLRARSLRFDSRTPHRLFLLAGATRLPPEPDDPSPLWWSDDAGRTFAPVPSRRLDRVRDPSGEITALTLCRDHDRSHVALGTDRGELLIVRGDAPSELLADGLPPIVTLASATAAHTLDPSTSGIHLLP
jgi:hypothetical protein